MDDVWGKNASLIVYASHSEDFAPILFTLTVRGNWFWKAQLMRQVRSAWTSWPTTAPLWVAESQVTACASWVLPRAFRSKEGLNLVVERFQSSINFIILGSERRWWTRLVSSVEVSIKTEVITTTTYAGRPRGARGTRRALQRWKWERGSFVFGDTGRHQWQQVFRWASHKSMF